jgi:GTPase Era involved in 16S rRNA processing
MGRTRTGKSTIAEVLATTLHKPKKLSIYSDTREATIKTFFTTDKRTGKSYRFTIIDTPGFFDLTRDNNQRLQNYDITEQIKSSLESNIRHVHLIGIVFNLSNGINERDIEAMIYIKENFRDIADNTALVITNCEQINEQQRNKLVYDFFQHRKVKQHNLRNFFRQGTLFMGCLRYESLETANEEAIYLEYNNVLDMRTAFIEKCIQCPNIISFDDSACSIM